MNKYLNLSRRSNSTLKSPINLSSRHDSNSENMNTTDQLGLKSFALLKKGGCPLPPKIPGLAKGHKRNFTSMLGGQTNLTQKVEEACIEEVVKTPQKKNLFHEAFNKRIKLTIHKRCSSRNEEMKEISNTSELKSKQSEILPPLGNLKSMVNKNQ